MCKIMSSNKFSIEGTIIDIDDNIVNLSLLLKTTLNTDLRVDVDNDGIPIVEIATIGDVHLLEDYYYNGNVNIHMLEAFDRLIVEPRITSLDKLKYYWIDKLCPVSLRDQKITATYVPVYPNQLNKRIDASIVAKLEDIWKPVRRYQDYGILLNGIKQPIIYTLIPIDINGPRGKVTVRFSKISSNEQCNILDDICYNAYDTLKKYRGSYTHLLVISDIPTLYSYDDYIKNYIIPLS